MKLDQKQMATKANFYIFKNQVSPKEHDLYICRIIEKAYDKNHKIYIYTADLNQAQTFDKQLWTFRDISFVPHEIYSKDTPSDAKILIGYDEAPATQNEILINLTSEIPSFYQQFNHIIEVIPNDENLKALGRRRFQTYKKQGYQTEVFNI